jgi:hypothetical protein
MAGLFDGEGCIQIIRKGTKTDRLTNSMYLIISVRNTDTNVMRWINATFGGVLHDCKPPREGQSRSWYWTMCSNRASSLLKLIRPYLRIKAEECDIAIEFQDAMASYKQLPYRHLKTSSGRGQVRVPDEVVMYRLSLAQQLKSVRAKRKRA